MQCLGGNGYINGQSHEALTYLSAWPERRSLSSAFLFGCTYPPRDIERTMSISVSFCVLRFWLELIFGAPDSDFPMGRIMRDSRLYTVGAGTQEIRRMLIGREFNQDYLS